MTKKQFSWSNPIDIKKSALKCLSVNQWREEYRQAHDVAKTIGEIFFRECTKHMERKVRIPYTKNELICEGKKYTSPSEWKENHQTSYQAALKYDKKHPGFYKLCISHMIMKRTKYEKQMQNLIRFIKTKKRKPNSLSRCSNERTLNNFMIKMHPSDKRYIYNVYLKMLNIDTKSSFHHKLLDITNK